MEEAGHRKLGSWGILGKVWRICPGIRDIGITEKRDGWTRIQEESELGSGYEVGQEQIGN